MPLDEVILVNEKDEVIGHMEKMEAHEKALLHRAFSVFIFNSKGELLLQQRALHKYHSAGLWTNTCCSHPRPGESTESAALRRLKEEMGMICPLTHKSAFVYQIKFKNGLTEHEYDHVFIGECDTDPKINPEEVNTFKWVSMTELKAQLKREPERYTYWFKLAIERFFSE
jgi:isopentenyl-diphosphate delta-isomerase